MKKYLIPLFYIWLMHNCLTVSAQDSIRIVPIRYHPSITDATKPKVYSPKDTLLPSIASAGLGSFQPSPSPETAQLNYRQDIPVNKFTGTPSINIPIYTLNEVGLSLPLNLSYNASGIRGHQLSGWSGLGWEITGIPTISRVVRGLPDEGSYEMTSPITYIEKRGFLTGYNDDDRESDLYFLNLHGVVYKFVFDAAGRSIFFPENDIYVTSNLMYQSGGKSLAFRRRL